MVSLCTLLLLDAIWGKGFTTIGNVTWQSAAYVARYCLKKITGKALSKPDEKTGLSPYERVDPYTLSTYFVEPEYANQSRNPGLGSGYLDEYMDDIYPWDECIVNGHPTRPPRYYDNKYEKLNAEAMEQIKLQRVAAMEQYLPDNTRARLAVKEKVKKAQLSQLKRNEV